MTDLAGKVALVAGGGSGIGRGIVLALADASASVVVVDLLEERARDVVAEVEHAGGTAIPLACDVSRRAEVKKLKAAANEAVGPVSLLFANAGVSYLRFMDLQQWDDRGGVFTTDSRAAWSRT
jgi:2-hydroxycyclohexanecarboxyl-CoA dehydrogenase